MIEIKEWPENVNQKILRNGAGWNEICGFIEDETRSGKRKRRFACSQGKRIFSVKMRFSLDEYKLFYAWYNANLKKGLYSFRFPQIDNDDKSVYKCYRFTADGAPTYSNPSGRLIECTMRFEEQ